VKITPLPLIVGLPGPELTEPQAAVLRAVRPAGIILFSRNVRSVEQVRALVEALEELEPEPFVAIDLEGGAVNRLAALWGDLPSPAAAARAGIAGMRALGEAAGAACRHLGVHLDLAPAVDLETRDGLLAREERCLAADPERVIALAGAFADGLEAWCVSACLKHYPGLGTVRADTHEELPRIELDEEGLGAHIRPFAALAERVPMVMMAHVVVPALGDAAQPASLAPAAIRRAASLEGNPVVISDDLEMGALAGAGDLEERALSALEARSHGVIISRSFDRLEAIAARLDERAAKSTRFAACLEHAAARLGTTRRDLCRKTATVPEPSAETVAQLWEAARAKVKEA